MKKLHHICIQTDVYEESIKFYTEILGFELIKETPDFHGRFYNSWLKLGEIMIELQTNKVGEDLIEFNKNNKGLVHFCLLVEDLEEEYKKIKGSGFKSFKQKNSKDMYNVENSKLLKLIAPEGTIIELRDINEI